MKLRKLLLGLLTLVAAVVLVACGSKTEKAFYQMQEAGVADIQTELTYQGDKLMKQETTTTLLYSAYGLTSADAAEAAFASELSAWDDIEGIDHQVTYEDDRIVEKTIIDYDKVDLEENADLLEVTTADGKTADYISYEQTVDSLESQGFEEVSDGKFKSFD